MDRRLLAFLLAPGLLAAISSPLVAAEPLTMERFFQSKWTYQPSWSPDGRWVAFLQDDWVTQNIFVVPASGGTPVRVSKAASFIGDPFTNSAGEAPVWSPDGKRILYTQDGDLYLATIPNGPISRLTNTSASESGGRFSPDGRKLVFSRDGFLFSLDLGDSTLVQLTREPGAGRPVWSPDGKWISFERGRSESVSRSPDISGRLLSFHWSRRGPRDVGIVSSDASTVRMLAVTPESESVADWSPDSRSLLIERRSWDVRDRDLLLVPIDGGPPTKLFHQHDDRFLVMSNPQAWFLPNGLVAFTSDADGWAHLYTVPVSGGSPRQLTKGPFEISFVNWTADGTRFVYCSTQEGTEQRHIYMGSTSGGEPRKLTDQRGVNTSAVLSPKGDAVVFLRSDPSNLPDVWSVRLAPGSKPVQLSESMSTGLSAFSWQTPQIVTFRSKAGQLPIKAQLFTPPNFDKSRKYPAIVHTHQAAIYQEVYFGPGPQKDNVAWYGFNQRLAQEGYVVLNVDYRGSSGYGREFAVADYRDLGGDDAVDVVSGVDYLKSLNYVDTNRLGVYGMSYGGHMVLSLLTKHPEVFRAGVDIAGVADFLLNYESLYGPWILGRLGTPDRDAEAYRKSSAVNFLENMKAPVMILHGTNDPNVTLLQSIDLVDRLLKLGKKFEFEVYPGEIHFFTKKRSWIDAFAKMERFFDENVRQAK